MKLSLSVDLSPLRADAYKAIDRAAGEVRGRFITTVAGQEMVYQEKEREALLIQNGEIDPARFPHLAAEALRQGMTFADKATEVINQANAWREASAIIEDLRLAAKENVAAAASPAQIENARQIDWSPVIALAP